MFFDVCLLACCLCVIACALGLCVCVSWHVCVHVRAHSLNIRVRVCCVASWFCSGWLVFCNVCCTCLSLSVHVGQFCSKLQIHNRSLSELSSITAILGVRAHTNAWDRLLDVGQHLVLAPVWQLVKARPLVVWSSCSEAAWTLDAATFCVRHSAGSMPRTKEECRNPL